MLSVSCLLNTHQTSDFPVLLQDCNFKQNMIQRFLELQSYLLLWHQLSTQNTFIKEKKKKKNPVRKNVAVQEQLIK